MRIDGRSDLQSGPRPQNPNFEQHPLPLPHGLFASQSSLKLQVERHPVPQCEVEVPQKPNSEQHPVAQSFVALQSCAETKQEIAKRREHMSNKVVEGYDRDIAQINEYEESVCATTLFLANFEVRNRKVVCSRIDRI